jgi:hypothetical protein
MTRRHWKNWAENLHCEAYIPDPPKNAADLKQCLVEAAERGGTVRAAGGSHSWAPLIPNEDTIIPMSEMNEMGRLYLGDGSRANPLLIETQCGITIRDLEEKLRVEHGYTLVSPTLFDKPTVGGVISTGSHGTGFRISNFSEQIREMTIVKADGNARTVAQGDPELQSTRVALGTLGIVQSVKLEVQCEYNVSTTIARLPVEEFLERFDDLPTSCEFLEVFWFPGQETMWLMFMNATDSPADRKSWLSRLGKKINTGFQNAGGAVIPWIASNAPNRIPTLNRWAGELAMKEGTTVLPASEAFHYQEAYPKNWDMSYAFPADSGKEAWKAAVDRVRAYANAEKYPVNLALHCRFTAQSTSWLAPDFGRPTCWVEVATAKGTPEDDWRPFFQDLESIWFEINDARPHWGKLYGFWQDPDPNAPSHPNWARLIQRYPGFEAFRKIRHTWDPNGVFLNPFLKKHFFP